MPCPCMERLQFISAQCGREFDPSKFCSERLEHWVSEDPLVPNDIAGIVLRTSSPVVRDAVKGGTLKVEAGVYNLATGKVTLS